MNDENLDKIFREGLSNPNVKFRMESWEKMEQMLPPEPAPKRKYLGLIASVLGFFIVVSSALLVMDFQDNDTELATNNTEFKQERGQKSAGSKNEETLLNSVKNTSENEFVKEDNSYVLSGQLATSSTLTSSKGGNATRKSGMNTENSVGAVSEKNLTDDYVGTDKKKTISGNAFFASAEGQAQKSAKKSTQKKRFKEEVLEFSSNVFTKISGINELAQLSHEEEEEQIVFADVRGDKLPKPKKNELGILAGVNINPSLNASFSGISGSEVLGVTYSRYLNAGFSLQANLLYSARSEVNTLKKFDAKYYDFGSKTEQISIENKRLVYLELPIMVNYSVAKHNVMVGGSMNYLLTAYNDVHTTITEGGMEETNTTKEWGYVNGFNSFDFALVAGYEYLLMPNWSIGGRVNYGLTDITKNDYFKSNSYDNNMQFRIYVKYSPFRF